MKAQYISSTETTIFEISVGQDLVDDLMGYHGDKARKISTNDQGFYVAILKELRKEIRDVLVNIKSLNGERLELINSGARDYGDAFKKSEWVNSDLVTKFDSDEMVTYFDTIFTDVLIGELAEFYAEEFYCAFHRTRQFTEDYICHAGRVFAVTAFEYLTMAFQERMESDHCHADETYIYNKAESAVVEITSIMGYWFAEHMNVTPVEEVSA